MDLGDAETQLQREGFNNIYVWQDGAEVFYPDHTHEKHTAHIILDGEMKLIIDGQSTTYYAGDRCDIAPGVVHSAIMGPHGCRYVVGEK